MREKESLKTESQEVLIDWLMKAGFMIETGITAGMALGEGVIMVRGLILIQDGLLIPKLMIFWRKVEQENWLKVEN